MKIKVMTIFIPGLQTTEILEQITKELLPYRNQQLKIYH